MGVIRSIDDLARPLLPACLNVVHPFIRQDLVECCSLLRIDLQHTANDVPTFPRQDAEKSPRAFDYLLALTLLLRARRKGWGLFAGCAGGFVVVAGLLLSILG